jgi:glycine dehydrogenase subunit 1
MKNRYIPHTEDDIRKMLDTIGVSDTSELFVDIPERLRFEGPLKIEGPITEADLTRRVRKAADRNTDLTLFAGGGAYDRLIPSVIDAVVSRSEFYTAYTPYQPEISQGTLQAIFEFQTMISDLTGMPVANASMYDGATALAEGVLMALRQKKGKKVLVSKTLHPQVREVLETYTHFNDGVLVDIPYGEDYATDIKALNELVDGDTAGIVVQPVNFYGVIEDLSTIDKKGALLINYISDAVSLALLKTPGAQGADIVCGEGQGFGIGLNFGGPYLGFMATTKALMRKMPGRIVGQSVDNRGNRAFVLTLQTREQHIRREKATSNICTNQGLNALTAAVYLSCLGSEGLKEAARQSASKAHYLAKRLKASGVKLLSDAPFFDEFAVVLDGDAGSVIKRLYQDGFLAGIEDAGNEKVLIICVTEKRTKEEIDRFADALVRENHV